jgi:hypothetical protein
MDNAHEFWNGGNSGCNSPVQFLQDWITKQHERKIAA